MGRSSKDLRYNDANLHSLSTRNDGELKRLKRFRSIQRFFAGSFVIPKGSARLASLTLLLLFCSLVSSTIFEYFAKERAELYWCYERYEIGQRPCETRNASKVDFTCMLLVGISLVTFVLSFLPFNVLNLIQGVADQRDVALTIMQTRRRRLQTIMPSTSIDLQKCMLLGGYEIQRINPNKNTTLVYWDAVMKELYTRVFSVLPCEVYCNWIYGHKSVSILIILSTTVSLFVPTLFFKCPIYINIWLFVTSLCSVVAPLHAIVLKLPLILSPRYLPVACVATGMIVFMKIMGLLCAKYIALKHEKQLVKMHIRSNDHWIKIDVKEKYLLYLLGFDGFF